MTLFRPSLFQPTDELQTLNGPAVLVLALDGWTDAGEGGSTAASALLDLFDHHRLGTFDADTLFDFRDRRPELEIDRGILGDLRWPQLCVDLLRPAAGPSLVLVTGSEPDLRWRSVIDELVGLCATWGIDRYVGLGSVPGPVPHTRPCPVICTGNDLAVMERIGRAHEQIVVPASFQVAAEHQLSEAGLSTLGMWVRVPHYIAGTYPQASKVLLEQLSAHLGTPIDSGQFDEEIETSAARLEMAAAGSDEVTEHVRQLERLYDAEQVAEGVRQPTTLSEHEVPSADELAAEIERFLKGRTE